MVSSRKRGRQEIESVDESAACEPSLLERIRSMWEFANLVQYIYIFGRAVKIDENLDIEELELDCLKSHSTLLADIGLALLKTVSSHRGLTLNIFDEYTRRQYVAKAPHRNPYGTEDEPARFLDFDIFTKIRVLQQLSQWTLINPNNIRERMDEQKDHAQISWRIEPFGWDVKDRTYYVLDDNRLYRKIDPPTPAAAPAKPKKNSKKAKAALRASKRRKLSENIESEVEVLEETLIGPSFLGENGGLGGATWECIAVTLDEMNLFLSTIEKSRDPNEKLLCTRIIENLLPLLEKEDESRRKKAAQKEREFLNAEKLATAKRSSRIAGKLEVQKQEEGAREAERKRLEDLVMAKKEQEKWTKLEKERESRMMTREQRVREREARRILQEQELANLSEDGKKVSSGEARLSERHLKAEIERKKQALDELAEEDEDWIFDCICGAYGQIDDGTHSIACEKCNIWLHSKCVGVSQSEAERNDFHFICSTCKRRTENAQRLKQSSAIKIKLTPSGSSSAPSLKADAASAIVVKKPAADGDLGNEQSLKSTQATKSTAMPEMHVFQTNGHPHQTLPPMSLPSAYGSQHHASPMKNTQNRVKPESHEVNPRSSHEGPPSPFIHYQPITHQGQSISSKPTSSNISLPSLYNPQQTDNRTYLTGSGQTTPGDARTATTVGTVVPNGYSSPYSRPASSHYETAATPNRIMAPSALGHSSSDKGARRSSLDHSSPTLGGPVLPPVQYNHITMGHNISGSLSSFDSKAADASNLSAKPAINLGAGPPSGSFQTPATQNGVKYAQDSGHTSALPPAVTGLSPTKHSPPRPLAAPGVEAATPSMLPPVRSLTPSPQIQNLSPPVKVSPPAQPIQNGPPFIT